VHRFSRPALRGDWFSDSEQQGTRSGQAGQAQNQARLHLQRLPTLLGSLRPGAVSLQRKQT
jgi:hypothetical protein